MDLIRVRQVSVGDRLWADFAAQAYRLNMNLQQAAEAALRQWVVLAPDRDHCSRCGQVLCENDHHMWWCEEAGDGTGSGAALGSRSDPRARGARDLPALPLLAPARVQ